MVIIYGGVLVDEAQVPSVTEAARDFQARCQEEDGCIDYLLSWDVAEPNRIRLLEAWVSEQAHASHTAAAHVQEWTAFITAAAAGAPSFSRHVLN
jgi:quinol monooxygenase YgiN